MVKLVDFNNVIIGGIVTFSCVEYRYVRKIIRTSCLQCRKIILHYLLLTIVKSVNEKKKN